MSCYERFVGNETILEFFELGSSTAPVKTMRVARPMESAINANVLDIEHEESAEEVRTRILALGGKRKYTLSVTTEHPTAPLEKAWDPAWEDDVLGDLESPKRANDSGEEDQDIRPEFAEAKTTVFRRFRLPECLRTLEVLKDLAIETTDGTTLPVQVWKFGRILTETANGFTSTPIPSGAPVLLEGAQLDLENGYFTLKEPAVNLVSITIDGDGVAIDDYEVATVGITITVAGDRLAVDTGVQTNGFEFVGLEAEGLVETVLNESFEVKQFTNIGTPFRDSDGEAHEFEEAYVLLEGTGWEVYVAAIKTQDDEEIFRRFALGALREKQRMRSTYNVTTPFWTAGYKLGDRVEFVGQDDYEFGVHQILSVSYDLTSDHTTSLSTDSTLPLAATTVLGGMR